MNELQRQLLADRINEVSKELEYEKDLLDSLNRRVVRKENAVKQLTEELTQLKEGVDW